MSLKKYLVLGTGVGKAIAYALLNSSENNSVTIADIDFRRARDVADIIRKLIGRQCLCFPMEFEVGDPNTRLIFKNYDVVISALPAKYNFELAKAAIKAGVHFCDLGGVVEVTKRMLSLNQKYPAMESSIVPDCGLMPGLGIIIAKKLLLNLGGAKFIEILVGGLPQKPQPPTYYQKVFHSEGLRHICYDMAPILSDGEIKLVKPFYDYSQIDIPELERFSEKFNGRIETFVTAGASLAAESFRSWGVKYFAEKTVRRPGFVDFFKKVPEYKFEQAIEEYLTIPVDAENPDLVWMRVMVRKTGINPKSVSLLDLYDNKTGLTAMQRTTGFTTAVIAEMIAEGKTKPGVCTPENAFDDSGVNEILERLGHFFIFKEN
ncbi:MAG: saccharopine dehydrogenase NADP-binding domain-containing protein [Candidatus Yanofskybacteria bacterium]|nr:saccharopine dehydrogenase NADP-binding domain-containing protein [Candidatus Yanofskybacteria bacterium]